MLCSPLCRCVACLRGACTTLPSPQCALYALVLVMLGGPYLPSSGSWSPGGTLLWEGRTT